MTRVLSLKVLYGIALAFITTSAACAAVSHVTVAGRDVAVWMPPMQPPPAGCPLIVFSHGFCGSNTQSSALMESLSQAGYVVLAVNHKDAMGGKRRYPGKALTGLICHRPDVPFQDIQKWSDATYRDRATDIEEVLNAVLEAKSVQGVRLDPLRIGAVGHSLGGYTVLGLAGGWPSWKDTRIKAVLALSPYNAPFVAKGDLGHLNVPVMYQGGTHDRWISPTVSRAGGAYDCSSAPKFYVEFDGAGHFAWTNLSHEYRGLIDDYAAAFFDRYLGPSGNPDRLTAMMKAPLPKDVSDVRAMNRTE